MEPPRPRRGRRDPYPQQNPYGQQPYEQSPYGPRYDESQPEQYQQPQQQPPQQPQVPQQPRRRQPQPTAQPQQQPQQPPAQQQQYQAAPVPQQQQYQQPQPQAQTPTPTPAQDESIGGGFFDDDPSQGGLGADGMFDPAGRVGSPVLDERLSKDLDRDFAGADRGRTFTYVLGIGALVLIAGTGITAMVGATMVSGGKPPKPDMEPQVVPTIGAHAGDVPPDPPTVPLAHEPFIPDHGTGKFTRASGETLTVGHGKVRRYAVEIEGGTKQSSTSFTHLVDRIMTDPRGWTAGGKYAFRRVGTGQQADFVIKLASPETTDKLCATTGTMTAGRGNCASDKLVVMNLKRWLLTTTYYQGQTGSYRAQMLNFEIGKVLHYKAVSCPGANKPAPAMLQQLGGLGGCRPNAWPYDRKGHFVTGPDAP